MISLILLFLSAVLSVVLIIFIPFDLENRQKKLISVAAPVIGSLGLAFSFIASLWQSVLVMVLLAASVGYAMISRATENFETERTGYVSEMDVHPCLPTSVDQDENNNPSLNKISFSNVVSSKEEEIRIVEDISFLEARNNREFEVIPVLNFEAPKEEVDDAAYETQPS